METVQYVPIHCIHRVGQLVGVTVEVKVLQEAGGKLAEECVVGLIDGPQTPVGVVVGAGARTESTQRPEGSGLPVVIVMCEASEARQTAVVSLPLPFLLLPFLLPSANLVVQLGLPVYFLRSLLKRMELIVPVLQSLCLVSVSFVKIAGAPLSTVTLIWSCPLQMAPYFPEVFDFVLKCFNLLVHIALMVFPGP